MTHWWGWEVEVGAEGATNEPRGLVGGGEKSWWRLREPLLVEAEATTTRWWGWKGRWRPRKSPMSREDSLVVVEEQMEAEKATESS